MELRITVSDGSPLRVRLDGRLAGVGVSDVLETCRSACPSVVLDLLHLGSADAAGIEALADLRAAGAVLENVPPYIRLLLESRPA